MNNLTKKLKDLSIFHSPVTIFPLTKTNQIIIREGFTDSRFGTI